MATSHAAVTAVLREPGWSSDHRNATAVPDVAGEVLSKILLFMDAPDHTRVRGLVSKAFTPRTIEQLRPRIAELTEEVLAPLREAGALRRGRRLRLPASRDGDLRVARRSCGDSELFRRLTRDMAAVLDLDATPEQFGHAAGAALTFAAYLVPLFEERRSAPRTDLISAWVAAEDAGDRLGADELLTTVILLLVAGHETTMNLIGNGLLALLRHPDQLALLRAVPTSWRRPSRNCCGTTRGAARVSRRARRQDRRRAGGARRRTDHRHARRRQPRPHGCSQHPTPSTSPATPVATWPSARAPTTASAPPSRVPRRRSRWTRSSLCLISSSHRRAAVAIAGHLARAGVSARRVQTGP